MPVLRRLGNVAIHGLRGWNKPTGDQTANKPKPAPADDAPSTPGSATAPGAGSAPTTATPVKTASQPNAAQPLDDETVRFVRKELNNLRRQHDDLRLECNMIAASIAALTEMLESADGTSPADPDPQTTPAGGEPVTSNGSADTTEGFQYRWKSDDDEGALKPTESKSTTSRAESTPFQLLSTRIQRRLNS